MAKLGSCTEHKCPLRSENVHAVRCTVVVARAVRITARIQFELRVEYSNTQPIPEVASNYRVAQNKRVPGSSVKFVMQQRIEMSQNKARNVSETVIRRGCKLQLKIHI